MSPVEQVRAMIARTPGSVDVKFGAITLPKGGIIDFDGLAWGAEDQAQIGVETITMAYCYPDLPGLGPDCEITAGGARYIVSRGPRRRGDGLEAVVILESA